MSHLCSRAITIELQRIHSPPRAIPHQAAPQLLAVAAAGAMPVARIIIIIIIARIDRLARARLSTYARFCPPRPPLRLAIDDPRA